MASHYDFNIWSRDRLQQFLRDRGLKTSGRKEELVALAYGASVLNVPKQITRKEEEKEPISRSLQTTQEVQNDKCYQLSLAHTAEILGCGLIGLHFTRLLS